MITRKIQVRQNTRRARIIALMCLWILCHVYRAIYRALKLITQKNNTRQIETQQNTRHTHITVLRCFQICLSRL